MASLDDRIAQLRLALKANDSRRIELKREMEIYGAKYSDVYNDDEARKQVVKRYGNLREQERQLWIERWEILDAMSEWNFQRRYELTA